MQCSVCGMQTDVLADGKCVKCYETAENSPNTQASGPVPIPAATDTAASPVQEKVVLTPSRHKVSINVESPEMQKKLGAIKPKKSLGKRVAKYAVFAVLSLAAAGGVTYYTLYSDTPEEPVDGALYQGNLTTVTEKTDSDDADAENEGSGEVVAPDTETEDEDTEVDADGTSQTSDAEEVVDERNIDTDSDGIADYIERRTGTNPKKADTDNDGIFDLDELRGGTSPTNDDTDGDGFKDGVDDEPADPLKSTSTAPRPVGSRSVTDRPSAETGGSDTLSGSGSEGVSE